MSWPKQGATDCHARLELSDNGCAIKELVVLERVAVFATPQPVSLNQPRTSRLFFDHIPQKKTIQIQV